MNIATSSFMERTRIDPFNPPDPIGFPTGTPLQRAFLSHFTADTEYWPTSYLLRMGKLHTINEQITAFNTRYGLIRIVQDAWAQRLDSRNREALWELTKRGEEFRGYPLKPLGDPGKHKLMRSLINLSFNFASTDIPGLTKRSLADIVAHDRCPADTKRAYARGDDLTAFTFDGETTHPDASVFGFSYGNSSVYFLGFEADRGTETRNPKTLNGQKKKNIAKTIRAYKRYFEEEMYRQRFGLKNMTAPIILQSWGQIAEVKNIIREVCDDPVLEDHFAITAMPYDVGVYPPPTAHLMTRTWERTTTPINFLDILGVPHDARPEGSQGERTHRPQRESGEGTGTTAERGAA